ncbi:cell division inhibitor SepF [Thermodesulfitimonas autotrophica]|jgi:cell division inhibitor SepF|uniref:Cell division protein SepF n=1 Tax=Thermodesulfitimonas autotrophica TaxID=1894989 RepID=A0A3N5AEH9_9THEO|nr:cell division protein SepF [Thermodesulfitimonas autotrophica]RPF42983.1 cell division inhibitor SepF [Thermodesulfitimonas autotrophica]
MSKKLVDKVLGFIGFEEEPEEEQVPAEAQDGLIRPKKGAVVSIHTQRQMRVVVTEPRSFDDAQEIVDHLRNRRPVVVNLERVETDLARRVVDFVSGAAYALGGSVQKVGAGIFLFAPNNVDIAAEGKEPERGLFPWMRGQREA